MRSLGGLAAWPDRAWRHPSAILLTVQLVGVLLYPFMDRSALGRSVLALFGIVVLFLAVVVGPYKRGDVTAWWGILASLLVLSAVAGARVLFIGSSLGAATPLILLGLGVVGLLLDVKRVSGPR